ncbi:c2 domain containing protein [Stylonychia lemnae]|uniref:C2 domain containing protein n=1 Tax=Stylonychia lemnae TaxID=5949 RepID=A0A078BAX9_STYLE|nr:c2 domain containing protein [Stylonychia lemnae]|eukprot:CDW90728.1 c2 domain containing protein [Stylonychia lemnae]
MENNKTLVDEFHELEKACLGYENFINCNDESYIDTLEKLRQLVVRIQREHLFSDNEGIKEIETDNLRLLLTPYYEADVLNRIMDNRIGRVQLSQTFYLEYLKLMNHYGMLEKEQKDQWKLMMKQSEGEEQPGTDLATRNAPQMYGPANFDHFANRNAKIAAMKRKKDLEAQLDLLKNYRDEDMKREFYMNSLKYSIVKSLDQLSLINQEVKLLEYQQTLPRDSVTGQPLPADKTGFVYKPMKVVHIPEDSPYLLSQRADGSISADQSNPDQFQKIYVQKDIVEQQMNLRGQYQNQVFKPGHILPTMSIEELADMEVADALERQRRDEMNQEIKDNEDPDSEAVLERERLKVSSMDNWKDYNPKGSGVTGRMPSDAYVKKEQELKKKLLTEEFQQADLNKDQSLTEKELLQFLDLKAGGKPFDRNIAKILFQKMDKNRDGSVSLDEFINCYIDGEIKLKDRLNEIIKQLAERRRQIDEFQARYDESKVNISCINLFLKQTEKLNRYGIMENSVLTVHVLQAEDLRTLDMEDGSQTEPYVILAIENQKIETRPVSENPQNPVWDERFTFEIQNGQEDLQLLVVNKDAFGTNETIGRADINLQFLKDQLKHDEWFDLEYQGQDNAARNSQSGAGSVHVILQWIYCREKYFEQALQRVKETLEEEQIQKTNIQEHLKHYRSPFKAILEGDDMEMDSDVEHDKLELEARDGNTNARIQAEEKKLSKKVDVFAHGIAKRMGYEAVPWFLLTEILTICLVGIYMMLDTDKIKKGTFRNLVIALICSFAYDLFWLAIQANSYGRDDSVEDGGIEKSIRKFSLSVSVLSIFFRVIVIVVFWKDSIDFQRIIKRRDQNKVNV